MFTRHVLSLAAAAAFTLAASAQQPPATKPDPLKEAADILKALGPPPTAPRQAQVVNTVTEQAWIERHSDVSNQSGGPRKVIYEAVEIFLDSGKYVHLFDSTDVGIFRENAINASASDAWTIGKWKPVRDDVIEVYEWQSSGPLYDGGKINREPFYFLIVDAKLIRARRTGDRFDAFEGAKAYERLSPKLLKEAVEKAQAAEPKRR